VEHPVRSGGTKKKDQPFAKCLGEIDLNAVEIEVDPKSGKKVRLTGIVTPTGTKNYVLEEVRDVTYAFTLIKNWVVYNAAMKAQSDALMQRNYAKTVKTANAIQERLDQEEAQKRFEALSLQEKIEQIEEEVRAGTLRDVFTYCCRLKHVVERSNKISLADAQSIVNRVLLQGGVENSDAETMKKISDNKLLLKACAKWGHNLIWGRTYWAGVNVWKHKFFYTAQRGNLECEVGEALATAIRDGKLDISSLFD